VRAWLNERTPDISMVYSDEQIARVVHAANAELQAIHGDPAPSQPWDHEPEEIRANVMLGVRNARNGFTPAEHHQSWVDDKLAHGWRYGASKDPVAKTHPCLVPYERLPREQRVKNVLFIAIVHAMWAEETPAVG
jgi:RyR domain